jgi:hypothetical protein
LKNLGSQSRRPSLHNLLSPRKPHGAREAALPHQHQHPRTKRLEPHRRQIKRIKLQDAEVLGPVAVVIGALAAVRATVRAEAGPKMAGLKVGHKAPQAKAGEVKALEAQVVEGKAAAFGSLGSMAIPMLVKRVNRFHWAKLAEPVRLGKRPRAQPQPRLRPSRPPLKRARSDRPLPRMHFS